MKDRSWASGVGLRTSRFSRCTGDHGYVLIARISGTLAHRFQAEVSVQFPLSRNGSFVGYRTVSTRRSCGSHGSVRHPSLLIDGSVKAATTPRASGAGHNWSPPHGLPKPPVDRWRAAPPIERHQLCIVQPPLRLSMTDAFGCRRPQPASTFLSPNVSLNKFMNRLRRGATHGRAASARGPASSSE
jgi:hypothetical protein